MYHKKPVEATQTYKTCDVCGAEIPMGLACTAASCEICGDDLCEKCIGHEDNAFGDYRVVWCQSCWDAGEPFRKEIENCERSIESYKEQWHDVAFQKRFKKKT